MTDEKPWKVRLMEKHKEELGKWWAEMSEQQDWFDFEETLRDLHARSRQTFMKPRCVVCKRVWPCDTIQALNDYIGLDG